MSAGKKIRVLWPEAPPPKEKDLTVCIMMGQCTAQVDGEGCEPAGAADIERSRAGASGVGVGRRAAAWNRWNVPGQSKCWAGRERMLGKVVFILQIRAEEECEYRAEPCTLFRRLG